MTVVSAIGWMIVLCLAILFGDGVGVIRAVVLKERSLKAEWVQRNLLLKCCFLGLFVVAYYVA